jgi:hypothetical protein
MFLRKNKIIKFCYRSNWQQWVKRTKMGRQKTGERQRQRERQTERERDRQRALWLMCHFNADKCPKAQQL